MMSSPRPRQAPLTVRYARALLRVRWPVFLGGLVFVGLMAAGGRSLLINDDYRYFFKADNPQLQAFNAMQDTYNKNDNILFVLEPRGGDVFAKNVLLAVETLTSEAWQIPYAMRVDSITNFQHTKAVEDDLHVADLVENAAQLTAEEITAARHTAIKEPLLHNRLVPDDGSVTGVNVTLELPGKALGENIPAVAYARKLVQQMETQFPEIKVHLTGFVMLNNAFNEASIHDMKTLVPLMYLMIIVMMAFLLRSISGTVVTVVLIGLSVMATMGMTGWLGIPLSPPSSIAPTLVMTLAVADSIHILVTVLQEMRKGTAKHEAIVESLRQNILPVFLTSITTAIGFVSLNFSDLKPINDLGNITAMGVILAFLLSITFLPAFTAMLPFRVKKAVVRPGGLDVLANFVIANRTPMLWGSAAVVVFLAAMVPRNTLNDEFVKYFSEATDFRRATDFASQNLTGIYQIEFSLSAGESDGINKPEYLAMLDGFSQWYRAQEGVVHVDTLSDTLKRLNKNMHGDDPNAYKLPFKRDLAGQYLLLFEMSLPYGLDLNNRINVDKSATRLVVTTKDLSTRELRQLNEAGEAWLQEHAPDSTKTLGVGPPVMFAYVSYKNSVSMFTGTMLAFLLITLTLIVALGSLKYGLLSLVPNLVPTVMAFGVWALFHGQINFGLTIVSALSIGIVVDDTVHFLSKYMRARREKGLSPEDGIRYAFATVGRAMVVTTLVLLGGFLILSFSDFDMNRGMGILTAITIAIALIADFLMLPALLLKLGGRASKAASKPQSSGLPVLQGS